MEQIVIDFDSPNRKVIIVPDADPNSVGAFVWWSLHGPLDLSRLKEAWSEELTEFLVPEPPSPSTALRRAVMEQQAKRRLARPLADERNGYALVDETRDEEKVLSYSVGIQIWLENDAPKVTPETDPLAATLKVSYEKHLVTVGSDDVRHWLSNTVLPRVLSVRLRESGGVYFIPNTHIRPFRLLVGAVKHASSHQIFAVPAQNGEDAVEGILEAIRSETTTEVTRMQQEIQDGTLGTRAIKSRLAKVDEQVQKAARYEALLGRKQPDIQKALADLRAHLAEAQMLAEAEKVT